MKHRHLRENAAVMAAVMATATLPGVPSVSAQVRQDTVPGISLSLASAAAELLPDNMNSGGFSYTGTAQDFLSPVRESYPSKFDMREAGTIGSVKNQTGYGTCWAHSAIASAETSVMSAEPAVDLSEFHTTYYTYYGNDQVLPPDPSVNGIMSMGGDASLAVNLWAQWIGPANESDLKYGDTDFFSDKARVEEMREKCAYHLENAWIFDYERDRSNQEEIDSLIKGFIMDGKAVDVSFYADNSSQYDSENYSTNSRKPQRFANHSVAIVGWDDQFPKEDFIIPPEHDGAWLIRNSWGTSTGDEGYMWISYDDKSLTDFAVYELGDRNNYATNYQHDTFKSAQSFSADTEENTGTYTANVFTAESDQFIDAIGTYFVASGTQYSITVYTDLTDPNDPDSGTPSAQTVGTADMTGYRTIPLDEGVFVSEGSNFAVCVKFYCPENKFPVAVEGAMYVVDDETGEISDLASFCKYEQLAANMEPGQSFYSSDGDQWTDMTTVEVEYDSDMELDLLGSLEDSLMYGLEEQSDIDAAKQTVEGFRQMFESGTFWAKLGNIPIKAFGNEPGRVEFSHISGQVSSGEKVALSADADEEIYYSINGAKPQKYAEPFAVTDDITVRASTDLLHWSQRSYTPAKAQFYAIGYTFGRAQSFAERIDESNWEIVVPDDEKSLRLCPVTGADILMDGEEIPAYKLTEGINIPYGTTEITFDLSAEGCLDNRVSLRIVRQPWSFDMENMTINSGKLASLTAPDGTSLESGSDVSAYAGEALTGVLDGEEVEVKVPERAELPDIAVNYALEAISCDGYDWDSIVYSTDGENFQSPEKRLFYAENSWYMRVIPGETVYLKNAGDRQFFPSETLTFEVPDAPEAPEEFPEYTVENGEVRYLQPDIETFVPGTDSADIAELAAAYGYGDLEQFEELIGKRFGLTGKETVRALVNSGFTANSSVPYGTFHAVRIAAGEDKFSSKVLVTAIFDKGDADGNGNITSADSSMILRHYAAVSTGGDEVIRPEIKSFCDMDGNGDIDSIDASEVLKKYVRLSV